MSTRAHRPDRDPDPNRDRERNRDRNRDRMRRAAAPWALALACIVSSACTSPSSNDGGTDASTSDTGGPPLRREDVTLDMLVRACVMHQSCGGLPGELFHAGVRTAACVADAQPALTIGFDLRSLRSIDCVNRSTDCASLRRCVALQHDAAYCATHPGLTCDGTVAVDCTVAGSVFAVDCAALGVQCVMAGGRAVCSDNRACVPSPGEPPVCMGTRLVQCDATSMQRTSIDCALAYPGWTCGLTGTVGADAGMAEVPRCVPAGAMCSGSAARCDGNTLVRCESGYGRESRTDCAAVYEGTCQMDAMGARCVPSMSVCDIRGEDFCNRTSLGVCVNGRYRSFECTSIGVAACVIDPMRNGSCRN